MVRLRMTDGALSFDRRSRGRGAHVHPRVSCVMRAPRGLGRAFRTEVHANAAELGRCLAAASERQLARLLISASRGRGLAIGAESTAVALAAGAPLAVLAADAGSCRQRPEVERAILAGRAMVYGTKGELGALLRAGEVPMCALLSPRIADELRFMRAAMDAGRAAMGAGAEGRRSPEGR